MYQNVYMNEKTSKNVILKGSNNSVRNFTFTEHSEWIGEFNFIQMADTQFGLTETFVGKDDSKWDIEISYTNKCIDIINNLNPLPEFVVVCGDMINSFPGAVNRKAQLSDFVKVFQRLLPSIPLICVCGNHDVGNTPTKEMIEVYKNDFGDDYMQFWVKGVKFIVLNSQYYADSSMCKDEADEHDEWLDNALASVDNKHAKHIIVFQHIPWFINDVEEKDDYFNIAYQVRKTMLEKLSRAGVSKIFAGHCHLNAGGWYEDSVGNKLEIVITSAVGYQLGTDEHGFRVVTISDNKVTHHYKNVFIDN